MLARDPWMAHSALSPAINLGLLHPLECVHAAEQAYRDGLAPLNSVEGYVRQVIGWREYIWSLYWHFPPDYRRRNALQATHDLPEWFRTLDADGEVTANCLSSVLRDLRERGWVHHIPRLMVLGNYALQRGWDPAQVTAWFHEVFVDGYDWVMLPNVTGMSQHADGGLMTTKPYAGGGAYINRMSDYCGPCAYDPKVRVGPKACPFTAGYWAFLDRNADRLADNRRMRQPLLGLERLRTARRSSSRSGSGATRRRELSAAPAVAARCPRAAADLRPARARGGAEGERRRRGSTRASAGRCRGGRPSRPGRRGTRTARARTARPRRTGAAPCAPRSAPGAARPAGADGAGQAVLAAQVVEVPDRALPPAVPGGEGVVHLLRVGQPAAADVDPAGGVQRHPLDGALHLRGHG